MMNEETKASLNKFLKEREERIKNMTLAEARDIISSTYGHSDMRMESDKALQMLLDCADKALEPKPMEKFEDVKTHIQRLAGDYKCWDNRLTWEEALELNRMLEAQPSEEDFVKHKKEVLERIAKREREIDKYIKELEVLDQQPSFINKPCISEGVCREDKIQVLEKIRTEIEQLRLHKAEFLTSDSKVCIDSQAVLNVIDKYKSESKGAK